MYKRLFILFLILGVTFSIQSQCVIDTNNFELISPASEYLPCIERNVAYSATIQLFAIPSLGFSIDSFLITSFLDLPSGINYSFNPSPCKLYPYDHGCVYLSGTTSDTAGFYPIDYNGFVYLQQGSPSFDYIRNNFPGQLPEYSLKVIEQGAFCSNTSTDIESVLDDRFVDFSIYPNPNYGLFELRVNSSIPSAHYVRVFDAIGKLVYSESLDINPNVAISLNLSNFPKGYYMVQVRNSEGHSVSPVIIQ